MKYNRKKCFWGTLAAILTVCVVTVTAIGIYAADYYHADTADLSETSLNVLSIYGSEDKVLNQEKYEKYKTNLPVHFSEFILDGGCHAYFGMYGEQTGDGTPTLENAEQIKLTVDKIVEFIK